MNRISKLLERSLGSFVHFFALSLSICVQCTRHKVLVLYTFVKSWTKLRVNPISSSNEFLTWGSWYAPQKYFAPSFKAKNILKRSKQDLKKEIFIKVIRTTHSYSLHNHIRMLAICKCILNVPKHNLLFRWYPSL